MRSRFAKHAVAMLTVAVLTLSVGAQTARADGDDVKGNIAGTIGLGLLGAEVGLLLPPAFNLQDHWWAWVLFPAIGAAGGAVAGALTFDEGDPSPKVTVPLLGAGFALAIPAIVTAVALKKKRDAAVPPAESLEGGAVLRLGKVSRHWGVPAVAAAPVYSRAEQARFGFNQRSMVQVPLVSGRF